jgi:ribosomal-protein-alanine N-acetyltransferase
VGGDAWATARRMTVDVRDATRADLPQVVAIERVSFGDAWSGAMFASHVASSDGDVFLVATEGDEVAGYAITRLVGHESELLNIAVDPAGRRRGVGALLLDAAMDRCRSSGGSEMWLEVRASNAAARTLYETRGFAAIGVRKRYYQAPREDAIVLRAALSTSPRVETVTAADPSLTADSADPILSSASHLPRQETK